MPLQTIYGLGQPAFVVGMIANQESRNVFTKTASANIAFGAPCQRNGDKLASPLVSGGEFIGIAVMKHLITGQGDTFVQYDNVPIADEGVIPVLADAAITVGAALRWNTATGRYTTAAASGTVIDVPGAEADTAASGAGATFKLRLRRVPS